jgi:hypothetical protein
MNNEEMFNCGCLGMYSLEVDDGVASSFPPSVQLFFHLGRDVWVGGLILELLVVPVPEDVGIGMPESVVSIPFLFCYIFSTAFKLVEVIGGGIQRILWIRWDKCWSVSVIVDQGGLLWFEGFIVTPLKPDRTSWNWFGKLDTNLGLGQAPCLLYENIWSSYR